MHSRMEKLFEHERTSNDLGRTENETSTGVFLSARAGASIVVKSTVKLAVKHIQKHGVNKFGK